MNATTRAEAMATALTGAEEGMMDDQFGVDATIIAVSVTLRVRNESMRAVLVLGEVIGVVEASLDDAPGNLRPPALFLGFCTPRHQKLVACLVHSFWHDRARDSK